MMTRSWLKRIVGVMLLLTLLSPRAAVAEDGEPAGRDVCLEDPPCREHYVRARQYFKEKRFVEALEFYKKAHERRQVPWLLINIGRSHYRLGQPREALDYYQRYQQANPGSDAEMQQRLSRYIAEAEALRGQLAPVAAPATTPTPEPIAAEFEPPPAPLRPEATAPPLTATAAIQIRTSDRSDVSIPAARPLYRRPWFWAMTAGIVAAGAVAAAVAVVVSRKESDGGPTYPQPIETDPDVIRYVPRF